jgi:hypothetical protein
VVAPCPLWLVTVIDLGVRHEYQWKQAAGHHHLGAVDIVGQRQNRRLSRRTREILAKYGDQAARRNSRVELIARRVEDASLRYRRRSILIRHQSAADLGRAAEGRLITGGRRNRDGGLGDVGRSHERLAAGGAKRRGRPPAWMAKIKDETINKRRPGRPTGSKNKTVTA